MEHSFTLQNLTLRGNHCIQPHNDNVFVTSLVDNAWKPSILLVNQTTQLVVLCLSTPAKALHKVCLRPQDRVVYPTDISIRVQFHPSFQPHAVHIGEIYCIEHSHTTDSNIGFVVTNLVGGLPATMITPQESFILAVAKVAQTLMCPHGRLVSGEAWLHFECLCVLHHFKTYKCTWHCTRLGLEMKMGLYGIM